MEITAEQWQILKKPKIFEVRKSKYMLVRGCEVPVMGSFVLVRGCEVPVMGIFGRISEYRFYIDIWVSILYRYLSIDSISIPIFFEILKFWMLFEHISYIVGNWINSWVFIQNLLKRMGKVRIFFKLQFGYGKKKFRNKIYPFALIIEFYTSSKTLPYFKYLREKILIY